MSAPATPDVTSSQQLLRQLSFAAVALAFWMLLHLYLGIAHDGIMYTMQALGHVHPELYGNDIFLRFGSQDDYSIFSRLYAALIRLLGVDRAAALLSLTAQAALLVVAWYLARRLMSVSLAWLAVGLLIVVEQVYGSQGIFHVVESFVSPRVWAESLVLLALIALLAGRQLLAWMAIACACALHPIMGSAGAALLLGMRFGARYALATTGLCVAALLALVALVHSPMGAALRFDPDWLGFVLNRAPYLVLRNWAPLDWSRMTAPLAVLAAEALVLAPSAARSLARGALAIAAAGLLLTALFCDRWPLVLAVQGQPWRWLWLAIALATLLIPLLGARLWQLGTLGRAALALLVAVYEFQDESYAFIAGVLLVAIAWLAPRPLPRLSAAHRRLILFGALGVMGLGLLWDCLNRPIYAQIPYAQYVGHPLVTLLARAVRGSTLPSLLLLGSWWLAFRGREAWRIGLGAAALLACVLLIPVTLQRWTLELYPSRGYTELRDWRQHIPPRAEVLYGANPLFTWLLLERPSFVSTTQVASAVFSHRAATVLEERLRGVYPFLVRQGLMRGHTPEGASGTLGELCQHTEVRYVLAYRDLGIAPLETLSSDPQPPLHGLKLYACPPPASLIGANATSARR